MLTGRHKYVTMNVLVLLSQGNDCDETNVFKWEFERKKVNGANVAREDRSGSTEEKT